MRLNGRVLARLLFSAAAIAGTFEERVAEGKKAAEIEEGKKYESSLGPSMSGALGACILIGATKVAECFATEFTKSGVPKPPPSGRLRDGYPIAVAIAVVP